MAGSSRLQTKPRRRIREACSCWRSTVRDRAGSRGRPRQRSRRGSSHLARWPDGRVHPRDERGRRRYLPRALRGRRGAPAHIRRRVAGRIAWTPDGRDLAPGRAGVTDGTLWRVSASGGTPERLPVPDGNAASPAIASRGIRLAYTHGSFDANIWRLDLGRAPFARLRPGLSSRRRATKAARSFHRTGSESRFSRNAPGRRDLGVRRRRRERRPVDLARAQQYRDAALVSRRPAHRVRRARRVPPTSS